MGRHTPDAILEVLLWQFESTLLGLSPTKRHDSQPWRKSDAWRKNKARQKTGFTASVGQLRVDWVALKMIFSFGGWNALRTQPSGEAPYTDVSKSAVWRSLRLTSRGFIQEILNRGHALSPLLSLPGFILAYMVIDVLHAVDLGSAQDAAGAFLYELIRYHGFLDGNTVEQRANSLWKLINWLYKQLGPPNRLQTITVEMICKKKVGAKPKLRTKGAEMRHLVPCLVEIAKRSHDHVGSPHTKCILDLFSRLLDFYMSIGLDDYKPEVTEKCINEFCLIYKALASEAGSCWFIKPKIHLMQEMALEVFLAGDPANYWTYKDEDYMGLISGMSTTRGGPRKPDTIPENVCIRIVAL